MEFSFTSSVTCQANSVGRWGDHRTTTLHYVPLVIRDAFQARPTSRRARASA
jgi:hypothetical protein